MMWWDNGMGWGGWIAMTLMMVAFWGLVVFGLIALFRGVGGIGQAPDRRPDPQQILDERYARGEIDIEEYQERQRVLRDKH